MDDSTSRTALELVGRELDNIRSALRWTLDSGRRDLALALVEPAHDLRDEFGGKGGALYGQGSYRLHPRLEVVADVREFDAALRQARGASRADQVVLLTRALTLYREPLLANVRWEWAVPVRRLYRQRYTSAARTLASL